MRRRLVRVRSPRLLTALAMAALTACLAAGASDAMAQHYDMGYRDIAADEPRPLLTIMAEFSDQRFDTAPTRHTPAFYAKLLFGDELGICCGSVAGRGGFFDENSHGRFRFTPAVIPTDVVAGHRRAGILGPYTHPDDPRTAADESTYGSAGTSWYAPCYGGRSSADKARATRCNVIQQAIRAGFPFRDYDRDGNYCITNDELTIQIIFADFPPPLGAHTGGQVASVGAIPLPGTPQRGLCPHVANVGESVPASTVAHELTHTLGAEHSYGASCRNYRYTVMSCPLGGVDDRKIVHLDPFTKMKLGWIAPRVIETNAPTTCIKLRGAELSPSWVAPQSYIVYDRSRGTDEYFILEYREVFSTLTYDGDPWGTGTNGLPDDGLAVWWVKIDPKTKKLLEVESMDGLGKPDAKDSTMMLLPRIGDPGEPLHNDGLWSYGEGTVYLRWLSDGGLGTYAYVQSEDPAAGTMTVRIGGGRC